VTTSVLAAPLRRSGVVAAVAALFGALLVLAAAGAVHLFAGTPAPFAEPSASAEPFSISAPSGWSIVRGSSGTVLRRSDGRATVVVRRTPPLAGDLRTVARELTARLERQVPGFRLVSARLGHVRAGGAFIYTFVRGTRAAQTLTVTKVNGRTYRIDSIVAADSPDAAREAGAAIGSFGP
jgi:hypothetical protein